MGLWLSTVAAAVLFIPIWFSAPILESMGQESQVARGAQDYLRIAGFGLWPALWGLVLRSYLSALEHTGVVLWIAVAVLIINAFVNYGLIFGHFGLPELGLRGAAIASVIAMTLSLVGFVVYIQIYFPEQKMFSRFWRFDQVATYAVAKLAVPISATASVALIICPDPIGRPAARNILPKFIIFWASFPSTFSINICSSRFLLFICR